MFTPFQCQTIQMNMKSVWKELSLRCPKFYTTLRYQRKNKVIRPKSRASALSEKLGWQTDEQTKTSKKTFEVATKSL